MIAYGGSSKDVEKNLSVSCGNSPRYDGIFDGYWEEIERREIFLKICLDG
jgi:hypothetical protein